MRLPLPADFFAPVRLSTAEINELQRVKAHLLSIYLSSYEASFDDTQSSSWQLVGQRTGVKIFKQQSIIEKKKKRKYKNWTQINYEKLIETVKHRECDEERDLPALRLVGSVNGTLEDILYGSMWKSGRERTARAHFTSDGVVDGAVLCSIVTPSDANPFQSLSVKWALKRAPHGGLVIKDRDFCYLSATGVVYSPRTRGLMGYTLRHSIMFPSCPPFENHSVVRGQIFLCSFFQQQHNGKVLVFHEGTYDVGGGTGAIGLGLPKSIAEKSILDTLLSLTNIRACALAKKLARAVEDTETMRAVASISSTSVQESLDGERYCGMCLRLLGSAIKRRCAVCRHWTCSQCSVRKEIVPSTRFAWINGVTSARCFCKVCVAKVLHDNAARYASQDANEHDYDMTYGRWDHDNISEENDNDDDAICMPTSRQSIMVFSAERNHSIAEHLSYQRRVLTLSTALTRTTENMLQASVSSLSAQQLSVEYKAMNIVDISPSKCHRQRRASHSSFLDSKRGGQTVRSSRPRRRASAGAPDIILRSDVSKRNWVSSTSALSLESPHRHVDGSPIVNYHSRRAPHNQTSYISSSCNSVDTKSGDVGVRVVTPKRRWSAAAAYTPLVMPAGMKSTQLSTGAGHPSIVHN